MSLSELLDRPIAFQRSFVRIGVGITGALMLSQAIYWSRRTSETDGWFYKSQIDWEEETGMTRYEQERARKALCSLGVLLEERRGIPAKLYYKVDFAVLRSALLGNIKEVTLEQVLTIYSSTLNSLSRTGLMRAKKLGVEAEYVDYAAVLKKHGMTCSCCGGQILYGPGQREESLAFDHSTPLSSGGAHVFSNIVPAHAGCNYRKGGYSDAQFIDEFPEEHTSLFNQNKLESKAKQSSLLSANKQECFDKADSGALDAQSNIGTETTRETTPETTTEISLAGPAGRNEADGFDGPKDPNAKTYATWRAYANAFIAKHKVAPKWNRAIGGMVAQVVARLGADDAPRVAEFYVTMNNAFYTQRMHPVTLLLRDCESIYAQFCTGRAMTSTRARQIDRQEANRGTVDDAMSILFGSQSGAHGEVIDA